MTLCHFHHGPISGTFIIEQCPQAWQDGGVDGWLSSRPSAMTWSGHGRGGRSSHPDPSIGSSSNTSFIIHLHLGSFKSRWFSVNVDLSITYGPSSHFVDLKRWKKYINVTMWMVKSSSLEKKIGCTRVLLGIYECKILFSVFIGNELRFLFAY